MINVVSNYANVDENTILGHNMIITGATINVNCKIGNHNIINTNSSIDHNSKMETCKHIPRCKCSWFS